MDDNKIRGRSRRTATAGRKRKTQVADEESASADIQSLTASFWRGCEMSTLLRYASLYSIPVPPDCSKQQLSEMIADHASYPFDVYEDEVIRKFIPVNERYLAGLEAIAAKELQRFPTRGRQANKDK
jgi:hypothetical protein